MNFRVFPKIVGFLSAQYRTQQASQHPIPLQVLIIALWSIFAISYRQKKGFVYIYMWPIYAGKQML